MATRMQAAAAAARAMRWRRVLCACAAAAALWAACGARGGGGPATAELSAHREFPRRAPHALAHLLADFSTLPHLAPHEPDPGSWRVEEERGNYTSWRYQVAWTCGARCTGRARVASHSPPPRPGAPPGPALQGSAHHVVRLQLSLCADSAAPCDEMDIRADVETDGAGGAVLRERAHATCAGDAEVREACAARLRRHRALHYDTLARA